MMNYIEIEKRIGITVSIGLSYNKTLAKIASTQSKPRGFSIIGKNDSDEFLANLSVGKISSIGDKLSKKLNSVRIFTLGDILKKDKKEVEKELKSILHMFNRQALHAYSIEFVHPRTEESVKFISSLPDDFSQAIHILSKKYG